MYQNLAKLYNIYDYKQKGGNPWGSSYESIEKWISELTEPSNVGKIEEVIPGNMGMSTQLIIIPGFSKESYERNFTATSTLNINLFKSCHYFKFNPQLRELSTSIAGLIKAGNEAAGNLENLLYMKCSEVINNMLTAIDNSWTVLAKSAGGGVGICLMKLSDIYKKLYLFAPGILYLANENCLYHPLKDNHKEFDIVIGWNYDDTKVPFLKYYPTIHEGFKQCGFRRYELHMYGKDDYDNSEHEINKSFIQLIR